MGGETPALFMSQKYLRTTGISQRIDHEVSTYLHCTLQNYCTTSIMDGSVAVELRTKVPQPRFNIAPSTYHRKGLVTTGVN